MTCLTIRYFGKDLSHVSFIIFLSYCAISLDTHVDVYEERKTGICVRFCIFKLLFYLLSLLPVNSDLFECTKQFHKYNWAVYMSKENKHHQRTYMYIIVWQFTIYALNSTLAICMHFYASRAKLNVSYLKIITVWLQKGFIAFPRSKEILFLRCLKSVSYINCN